MQLDELKLNRFVYRANASPVEEDPVYMSSNISSQKNIKTNSKKSGMGDAESVLTGTVITSCYVRSSDKNTRVELVPVSFNQTGFDVFGEQTFEDALIAWQDINIPAVVIDHNGIYGIDAFFENLFALNLEFAEATVSILTVAVTFTSNGDAIFNGPADFNAAMNVNDVFNYQSIPQPIIYTGQVESDGTFIIAPPGFSVSQLATGIYEIEHNIGDLNYTVQVSCQGGAGYVDDAIASIIDVAANTFVVNIYDANAAFANADTAFFFTVCRVL